MHVLVVPSYYPSDYAPGSGVFVRDQVDCIRSQGHKVGVAYTDLRSLRGLTFRGLGGRHFQVSEEWDGFVPVVRWNAWNVPRGEFAITRLGIRRAFNSYARRFGRPDLVHAHCGLYGGVAALELKERFGIPFVLTEHWSGYEKNIISERMGSVLRDVLAAAERVVVVSAALSRSISPYCEEVIVIPNTVDTDFFANIQRKPSSGFQVVSVGSLKEVKGFDVLLEAFARLARDRQGVHLNIVGEGALLGDLKGLAAQLGISTIVTFHGQLSRADLGDLLSSANLYVSASRVETFGVAIAEAMSCGLPVVATSSGGSQDIVTRPELGVLVPVGDTESLAFEMRRAFDSRPDLDLERAVKARSAMVDQYGPQVIGDTLDDLYREVSRSLVC